MGTGITSKYEVRISKYDTNPGSEPQIQKLTRVPLFIALELPVLVSGYVLWISNFHYSGIFINRNKAIPAKSVGINQAATIGGRIPV